MSPIEPYSSYSEPRDDPQFSAWLQLNASEVWEEMLEHQFIEECTDGSIDPTVYQIYLEQEFAFVETAAVSLGYAIANAPSFREIKRFSEALHGLVTDQWQYFMEAFEELNVGGWRNPNTLPETKHLSDIVYRGATIPGYAESLAPMVAAEWMYATWCHRAAVDGHVDSDTLVGEWIQLHNEEEFQTHARWLREEIDRVGPTLSTERQQDIAYLFRRTLELEKEFHSAPYNATSCR